MANEDRKLGIDVLGALPWGKHLCYFYNTKQDLVDVLVPYFKAGLENNESCIWITAEPLSKKEAEEAMGKTIPDFPQYLAGGQVEIIPHTNWYLKGDIFNGKRVLNAWIDKLERAMASGYDGMRVTGDMAWLERRDWNKYIAYEGEINNAISKYHVLTICTYPLHKHGASQAINVISKHQYNLIKHKGDLVLIGGSVRERAEKKEQAIISTAIDGFWITDLNGKFVEVNDSYCRMIGYKREELLKMSITDVEALEHPEDVAKHIKKITLLGSDRFRTQHRCKNGKILDIEINTNHYNVGEGQLFVFIHDLSGRKEAEDSRDTRLEIRWRKDITRLQEKFVKEGFQNFEDREIIELLLSMVMPARKAKQLSIICIDRFKKLSNFLEASPEELTQIGVTPACVFCIAMLHKLPLKVLQEKIKEQSIYDSPQDVFDYLYYSMRDLKKEVFKVIFLNPRNQITEVVDLFEGTTDKIAINGREVVESAIAHNMKSLIFVHNHPSGDPAPSKEDNLLTRDLVFMGRILQIKVLDHIIIGENRYFSFADEGLIKEYETDFLNLKLTGTSEAKRRLARAK